MNPEVEPDIGHGLGRGGSGLLLKLGHGLAEPRARPSVPPPLPPCMRHTRFPRIAGPRQDSFERRQRGVLPTEN